MCPRTHATKQEAGGETSSLDPTRTGPPIKGWGLSTAADVALPKDPCRTIRWGESTSPAHGEATQKNVSLSMHRLIPSTRIAMATVGALLVSIGTPLLGATPAGAAGTTWYVSQSGSGSSCTSLAPCDSVNQALSLASSGDTIEVSGTIEGNVFPEVSVTIEQMPGGSPAELHGSGSGSVVLSEGAAITLERITITGGKSSLGGGINNDGGSITVEDSTISGNTASGPGGMFAGSGGGIFNEGTLVINDSTISGNTALGSSGGPISTGGTGGGISNDGDSLVISDSTISGNTVTAGSGGGSGRGAGIEGSATLAGDILATSSGAPAGGECAGTITDEGYNVDDDGTCGLSGTGSVSDSSEIDGFLGSLANNGGPTDTVALTAGPKNPAEAAIPATFTAPGQTVPACSQPDQRGTARGTPCDMGAYALTGPPVTSPAITSADSATFTVGTEGSFQVTSSGVSGPTFTEVGRLPAGVSLSAEGVLSGTPANGTGGTYPITITASNGMSSPATQDFTLTVDRASASTSGYLLAGSDGGVFGFAATFLGSMAGMRLDAPVVAVKRTADDGGYWLVSADGGVFAFGDAPFLGSMADSHLAAPIVGMAITGDSKGYWLVSADGGVFAFGDAPFLGSMAGTRLDAPIVAMKRTSDGKGYWLVSADGGVFAFGNAPFLGSMADNHLAAPIVGMATTSTGGRMGYWLAGADGGVFAFGDAPFFGSMADNHLAAPIVGMATSTAGSGYWLAGADGGVFAFGDAPFHGSMSGTRLDAPIVGIGEASSASAG